MADVGASRLRRGIVGLLGPSAGGSARRGNERPLSLATKTLLFAAAVGVASWFWGGRGGVDQATLWLIFGMLAVGVDVWWGYAGLLSFGHGVFFGLGAFGYAWITAGSIPWLAFLGQSPLAGVLVGVVAATAMGAVVAYFLSYGRVTGAYFCIVTMALSFLLAALAQGTPFFGGFTGLSGIPPLGVGRFSASGGSATLIIVAITLTVVVFLLRRLLNTDLGRVVDGARENETRIEYLGANVPKLRVTMMAVSAGVSGLAGVLFAAHSGYVSSDLLGMGISTEAVIWVAVGGRMTLIGPVIGAVAVRAAGYALSGIATTYWQLFLGLIIVALVLYGGNGIVGLVQTASGWIRGRWTAKGTIEKAPT